MWVWIPAPLHSMDFDVGQITCLHWSNGGTNSTYLKGLWTLKVRIKHLAECLAHPININLHCYGSLKVRYEHNSLTLGSFCSSLIFSVRWTAEGYPLGARSKVNFPYGRLQLEGSPQAAVKYTLSWWRQEGEVQDLEEEREDGNMSKLFGNLQTFALYLSYREPRLFILSSYKAHFRCGESSSHVGLQVQNWLVPWMAQYCCILQTEWTGGGWHGVPVVQGGSQLRERSRRAKAVLPIPAGLVDLSL